MPTPSEKTIATSLKLPASGKAQIDECAAQAGMTAHAYMVRALARTAQRAKLRAQFLQDAQEAWEETERSGTAYYPEDVRAYFQAQAAWRRGEGPEPIQPPSKPARVLGT
jgi:predicted transcriptional regulator